MTSYPKPPLATGFAIDIERALASLLCLRQQPLELGAFPQPVELAAVHQGDDGPVVFGDRAAKKVKSGVVAAHVAEKPSLLENRFRILLDFEMPEDGHASVHLVAPAIQPGREVINPGLECRNARQLAHLNQLLARLVASAGQPQPNHPDPVVGAGDHSWRFDG